MLLLQSGKGHFGRVMTHNTKKTASRRILAVMESIIQQPHLATASRLSRQLAIPLPTVYRLVDVLVEEKFVSEGPLGYLVAGPRFRALMLNSLTFEPRVSERRAILKRLSAELDETVSVSVPNGESLVYFERFESHWPLQKKITIGDSLPLHCSASGKLYLSTFERESALRVFKNLRPIKHTGNSITSPKKFADELDRIAADGCSFDKEEWFDGMIGAAVPVRAPNGIFCASLSTHSLTVRKTISDIRAKIPRLLEAASALEKIFAAPDG